MTRLVRRAVSRIRGWAARRPVLVLVGLGLTGALIVGVGGFYAYQTYDWVEHDNDFCLSCHLMQEPHELFAESAHRGLGCKACHTPTFAARSQMALTQIIESPDTLLTHAEVPNEKCASCHIDGDPERWEIVASSAGHRVHLESDDPSLEGLQCVQCHSSSLHEFTATDQTCGQSGCHTDVRVQLGRMGDFTIHCAACHAFAAPVSDTSSLAAARVALEPSRSECLSCHVMRTLVDMPADEPHQAVCSACHNPHTQTEPEQAVETCATAGCHGDVQELTAFHRGLEHPVVENCTTCHAAHVFRVDGSDCLSCHQDIFEDAPQAVGAAGGGALAGGARAGAVREAAGLPADHVPLPDAAAAPPARHPPLPGTPAAGAALPTSHPRLPYGPAALPRDHPPVTDAARDASAVHPTLPVFDPKAGRGRSPAGREGPGRDGAGGPSAGGLEIALAGESGAYPAGVTPSALAQEARQQAPPTGSGQVVFRHASHRGVECSECHSSEERHGAVTLEGIADCRSCHHTGPAAETCETCHTVPALSGRGLTVSRAMDLSVGRTQVRLVPFEHADHSGTTCSTCHAEGLQRPAQAESCNACHTEHHVPTADCMSCHAAPAAEAHTVQAHLGCGGAGCHTDRPFEGVPRDRDACLSCHQDLTDHRPGQECVACHALPDPVGGAQP